jgi:hypothetical protein
MLSHASPKTQRPNRFVRLDELPPAKLVDAIDVVERGIIDVALLYPRSAWPIIAGSGIITTIVDDGHRAILWAVDVYGQYNPAELTPPNLTGDAGAHHREVVLLQMARAALKQYGAWDVRVDRNETGLHWSDARLARAASRRVAEPYAVVLTDLRELVAMHRQLHYQLTRRVA